jgi:hypothetical protein
MTRMHVRMVLHGCGATCKHVPGRACACAHNADAAGAAQVARLACTGWLALWLSPHNVAALPNPRPPATPHPHQHSLAAAAAACCRANRILKPTFHLTIRVAETD